MSRRLRGRIRSVCYARAERVFQAGMSAARALHQGTWLGVLDREALVLVTGSFYSGVSRYATDDYNCSGLLSWEAEAVGRAFPRGGRVIVIGAGGGREVIALERRGFAVEGFECNLKLVEYGNGLLSRLGMRSRLAAVGESEVPALRAFDAALVGWGAYMHIPGRARRIRFLRGLRGTLSPGGPLLLSFFVRRGTGRAEAWTARLANALRSLRRRSDDPVELGDRLQGSFDHYFTKDEVRDELEASGFQLAHYSEADYGHALGIADETGAAPSMRVHDGARPQPLAWDDVVRVVSCQVSSPVCDQVALLGLDEEIHRSRTGARVWELVRQPVKVSEIHRTIVHELGIDEEAARRDVLEVLTQLRDAALIEVRRLS